MSSSKLISGDELNQYQRWELPDVQTVSSNKPRVEDVGDDTVVKPLTAEELERIHQDAYREGFEQGRKDGLASGANEIREAVTRVTGIVDSLAQPLSDVDEAVMQELTALALSIAQQIVRREIKTEPGEVIATVQQALSALPSASKRVQIAVHPDDAKLLHEFITEQGGEEHRWHIVDDPLISRGGCKITSEHSQIDATVEARIASIAVKLLGGERQEDDDDGNS